MSKKPRTPAEYIWSSLKLKSTDSASIEDILYYVIHGGYEAFTDIVQSALEIYDRNGKGQISFKDFQDITSSTFDPFTSDDALAAVFKVFDKKGEGYLYPANLLETALELKLDLTTDEAGRIIESMDFDQDGAVDLKEFKTVVRA